MLQNDLPDLWLKPLSLSDEPLVDALLDQLHAYSLAVDGVPKKADGARHFLAARPPDCAPSQKHALAVMERAVPIGLVDLIDGYPQAGTVFVGLLAIAEDRQRAGWGRGAFRLVERFVKVELGASTLRLAVVASNPVSGFWLRMGFVETGETRPFEGEAHTSSMRLMEKFLPPFASVR